MTGTSEAQPRCAVIVGGYTSGKTSLLEALLATAGAIGRQGTAAQGNMVGDSSREARERRLSVEPNVAHASYLGQDWALVDCPGNVELAYDSRSALMAADMAVVVADPEPDKALTLAPLFRFLDERAIPHLLFVNKMDKAGYSVRETMAALQAVSPRPLVLRQVPIREGESVTGYVDLVSERAYRYRDGQPSELVSMPETVRDRESEARQEMLESLADADDDLLEKLLDDVVPPPQEIYGKLAAEVGQDLVVPVLLGAAEHDHGVTRLWKALRHDTPDPAVTAPRLGVPEASGAAADGLTASVVKTFHQAHAGKLSLTRIWRGELRDNAAVSGSRAGLYRMMGGDLAKIPSGRAGDLVAIARAEALCTGDVVAGGERVAAPDNMDWPAAPAPVYALALEPEKRADEVKLTGGLAKLVEEDPSLAYGHDDSTGQLLIQGQGPQHLALALARLENRFNIATTARAPGTPYRESIRKTVRKHTRFKRQTGGHGQFADIHVTLEPRPRGSGFAFADRVVGGAVPRSYIPAVETGIREGLQTGPLGFPVVDVAATLEDGQYHSVDSSEQAFKTAGRMAVADALPEAQPVLLEPVDLVTVYVPQSLSNKVHGMISGRRGQILGFDSCAEWDGWDAVQAYMPAAELADLIVELRSLSMGVGFFERRFDHLQEITGKLADKILAQERAASAAT
jgi:elongation factor G